MEYAFGNGSRRHGQTQAKSSKNLLQCDLVLNCELSKSMSTAIYQYMYVLGLSLYRGRVDVCTCTVSIYMGLSLILPKLITLYRDFIKAFEGDGSYGYILEVSVKAMQSRLCIQPIKWVCRL